jgi:predicted branched-subunit amino acid permease
MPAPVLGALRDRATRALPPGPRTTAWTMPAMQSPGAAEPPTPLWRQPTYRQGARDMLEVAPGIFAWGLVTGVAMINSGLPWPLAIFMSLVVFAGSAQLVSLPLIASQAPLWVVWLAALCVNLRFVIFSAQWRPYWAAYPRALRLRLAYFAADLNYVLFMRRFPKPQSSAQQHGEHLHYLWGTVSVNWVTWQSASFLGMVFARQIPESWGLAFAGTLMLMALTCSLLVDRATWAAAGVAGCAAVAAYALPLKLNIVVAVAAAVAVGLLIDHTLPTRPTPVDDRT